MTFARTKIQPPRPRSGSLIERPALEARLAAAMRSARLVLVCASAGYGKTSAVARAAATLPEGDALAWVACDVDDTPLELLECLLAALEPYDPPWRVAPEALLRLAAEAADEPRLRALAADIINALDACAVPHGVIVADDLHRVQHTPVFMFLQALIERLSERWTLVLLGRTEPALPLSRWRAAGELAEFRAADLRFDEDEVARLVASRGGDAAGAGRLLARTEGWPAGLRLALAAPQGPAAEGTIDRHVFDFLTSEVIDRLPADEREFLIASSVLPELTPERCAAVTGDAEAATRLDTVLRHGLFVTVLDDEGPTLRLHDLFRGVLETRFARERPEAWRAALRRAAATETDVLRRVAWLQRAEAWDEAETELAAVADEQMAVGAIAAVRRLFEAFPAARREHSARLKMLLARTQWDWDTAVDTTAEAAAALAAEGRADSHRRALSYHALALAGANRHAALKPIAERLLAEPVLEPDVRARTLAALAWVTLAQGDQRTLAPMITQTVEALERGGTLANWLECAPLGPYVGLPGTRTPLLRYVQAALDRVPDQPTPLRGVMAVLQGWLALWRGDIAAADAAAEAAASESRWLARPVLLDAPSRGLQATLASVKGDPAGLQSMLKIARDIEASGVPVRTEAYLSLYLFHALRCAAALEDRDATQAAAARLAAVPAASRSWVSVRQRAGAQAHLAALAGDDGAAIERWRAIVDDEWHADLYGQVAEARLRLADGLLRRRRGGDVAEAGRLLATLGERLDESGEWGQLLLVGPALLGRLATAEAPAALRRAAALSRQLRGGAAPAPVAAQPEAPPEGLSARELEVLERIAAGDSNKLIARALDLSPHTVKRHVANILDKLALESRAQAAAWYVARQVSRR